MYISIDKENLRVVHKHPEQKIVSNLCSLELSDVSALVTFCDEKGGFSTLSDLELKLLIRNSNGPDVTHVFSRDSLAQLMAQIAMALPETPNVNGFELQLQLDSIAEEDTDPYQYVRGSNRPKPLAGIVQWLQYAGSALNVPASAPRPAPQGVAAANSGALFVGRDYSGAKPAAPTTSSDDFVAPREGTSTHTIFTYCATAWRDAGYEDNKSTLDNIRKKAVDVLCAQGLNISTVRTQAARWYQHRQRFVI